MSKSLDRFCAVEDVNEINGFGLDFLKKKKSRLLSTTSYAMEIEKLSREDLSLSTFMICIVLKFHLLPYCVCK